VTDIKIEESIAVNIAASKQLDARYVTSWIIKRGMCEGDWASHPQDTSNLS
jgi:hypothetical protein